MRGGRRLEAREVRPGPALPGPARPSAATSKAWLGDRCPPVVVVGGWVGGVWRSIASRPRRSPTPSDGAGLEGQAAPEPGPEAEPGPPLDVMGSFGPGLGRGRGGWRDLCPGPRDLHWWPRTRVKGYYCCPPVGWGAGPPLGGGGEGHLPAPRAGLGWTTAPRRGMGGASR